MPAGPRRAGGEGGEEGSERNAEGSSPTAVTSLVSLTPCQQSRKADGKKKKNTKADRDLISSGEPVERASFFFLQLNIKASVKGDLINHFIGRIIGNKLLDN